MQPGLSETACCTPCTHCRLLTRAASSSVLLASDLTFPVMIEGKKGLNFLSLLVLLLTFAPAYFPRQVPLHISSGIRTAWGPAPCLIRSTSSRVYVNVVSNKNFQNTPNITTARTLQHTARVCQENSKNTNLNTKKEQERLKKRKRELLQQAADSQRHLEKKKIIDQCRSRLSEVQVRISSK